MSKEYDSYLKNVKKGRAWLKLNRPELFYDESGKIRGRLGYKVIAHHGVKGMKWGIRKGPPYPLEKSVKRDRIVSEAIESGQVSTRVKRDSQLRHTLEEHTPGRSYINGDLDYAQKLIDELSGTGRPVRSESGEWQHMERVEASESIGVLVDYQTGRETQTKL